MGILHNPFPLLLICISPILSMIYIDYNRRLLNKKINVVMEQHKKDMDIKLKNIMKPYKI
jgi:hypothetical protein